MKTYQPRRRRPINVDPFTRARCDGLHLCGYCPACEPDEYARFDAKHKAVA